MGRPAALSRERIAQEALALLDEGGAAAMTMRAVAQRLQVRAPSIYHHFSSQDDLVDAVHELVVAEIDLSGFEDSDWRTGVAGVARSYRETFVRHAEAVALVSRRPVVGGSALTFYERLVRALLEHGVPNERVLTLVGSLDFLVLGSAVETFTAGFHLQAEDYAPDYPALASALQAADLGTLDDAAFHTALDAWLACVAATIGDGRDAGLRNATGASSAVHDRS